MSDYQSSNASGLAPLVEENTQALDQLARFVTAVSDAHYCQALGQHGTHSLGKHVRHIIDCCDALLQATAADAVLQIDYENRARDSALESSPVMALERVASICEALDTLAARRPIHAAVSVLHVQEARPIDLQSSVGRELSALFSHTVHHMAIIGLLAEQLDVALPSDFGVHPSTLRHWQRQHDTPVVRQRYAR